MQQTCTKGVQDHAWLCGKGIHMELSKRLNFHYTTKWNLHKPESVQEIEMHKILWDFEIQKKKSLNYNKKTKTGAN